MGEKFREGKFCEFGQIVKIANIKSCKIFPLYGIQRLLVPWFKSTITKMEVLFLLPYTWLKA